MRIVDPLYAKPDPPGLGHEFPATAGKRFVDWAEFVAAEPHDIPPDGGWLRWLVWRELRGGNLSTPGRAATIPARGKPCRTWLKPSSSCRRREIKRGGELNNWTRL